ncbi:hypothetical protein BU24DRAFT_60893 [Aaosphaeria arxii CBS 175.79]|uniref:Uncharacterized protein n=1 Tax=Aaosphaeria arxii CBS 175.79 TaxID=1450172 RepID=A0A6A5XCF6_9PLEO|nr:uncharacterized protein BU24DRAFT_60893 [Aaosphaeria arxii CBS 175.79]KAF2010573.1 hypothetical protein BU24DRAFT_60893 [Aaosphaeria arxii CBS 175.79]
MAALGLGIFLGGCITAIPVVTGVAEGVEHQKKQNEEAANETRMIKFNVLTSCDSDDELADEIDDGIVVVRHNKVWILPCEEKDGKPVPIPPEDDITPPLHAFAGFYIQYPDDDRSPPERGMVSTISDDPPMLNWIYIDKETYELRYGNRTASIEHIVGEWDWTEDESAVTLEGWEGFVAVDESDGMSDEEWESTPWGAEGLRWAVYFDRDDNGLSGKIRKPRGKGQKSRFEVVLNRKLQSDEEQLKQMEDANKKMQVKSQGGLKSQFTAPAANRRKNVWGRKD